MKTALCVRNWDKWQSYRKDRGTPPWIKVHRVLFTNPDWAILTDAEKGQLVSIWIAAADNNGCIPDDPRVLRKICMLDDDPNISKFIELGFLVNVCQPLDNQVTPTCQPLDAPETETETETEEEESPDNHKKVIPCPHRKIVDLYNSILSSKLPQAKVELWNGKRKTNLSARWKESEDRQNIEWWESFFTEVASSKFLTGDNDRSWKADIGWLVNQENMVKVLEGKYGGEKRQVHDCSRCNFRAKGACKVDNKNCNKFMEITK